MAYVCEIPYQEYKLNLRPLFEGGVTWNDCVVYADDPSIPISGTAKTVCITLHREDGKKGGVEAPPELRRFFNTLNWQPA